MLFSVNNNNKNFHFTPKLEITMFCYSTNKTEVTNELKIPNRQLRRKIFDMFRSGTQANKH